MPSIAIIPYRYVDIIKAGGLVWSALAWSGVKYIERFERGLAQHLCPNILSGKRSIWKYQQQHLSYGGQHCRICVEGNLERFLPTLKITNRGFFLFKTRLKPNII